MSEKIDEIDGRLSRWSARMVRHQVRSRQDKSPKVEQIQFQVVIENDQVLLKFGKPVAWIAFEPEQALVVAQDIVKKVKEITGE